ncbi:MAG TPA: SGNH/GDSL hydrolase family protein [Rhodoblastus sp.]|nr:SGNH/GDSL hydrolase family protein [Rhodoblastus sp.]
MTVRIGNMARALPENSVVVLGDSIVARWPKPQLAGVLGDPIVVLANGGDRIENTNWTLTQVDQSKARTVRRVVSEVGTANLTDTGCEFVARTRAYFQNLRRVFSNAKIYALNIYQKGLGGRARVEQVRAANEAIRSAAADNNIAYVDIHDPLENKCVGQESCALLEANRVHPSQAGYDLFTAVLQDAMRRR